MERFRNILCMATTDDALERAVSLAKSNLITYVEQTRSRHAANLEKFICQVTKNLGHDTIKYLNPQLHLVKGCPDKEIPALANKINADLVIMGTAGRTGIHGFTIGNTAETVFNRIDCSMLTINIRKI